MEAPHLDVTIAQDDLQAGAVQVLSTIRPHWRVNTVGFKIFTDGITNNLIGCFNPECPTDVILVRVYGQNTDLLIDRKAETETIKVLQGVGFAPPLFATFNNGLAYQYIPGEVLTVETVCAPSIYPLIARKMAQLHKVKFHDSQPQPTLWAKIRKFISLVPNEYAPSEKQQRYVSLVAGGAEMLGRELEQLTTELSSLGSPVVFCHNDLLLANVIHQPGSVNFIDYEYAAYNYQAYDIGNHFDEFAGVTDVDFSRYPSQSLQWDWLRIYLTEYTGCPPSDDQIHSLYVQVNKFALAAHFLWGVWALVQAEHSNIDFDFLEYAGLRLNEYFSKKESFLAMKMPR
ncbi:ethanolamine kinase 1 [Homalodisca vitripennis]|uniref:ethanolamine kinase n=1 Tax=Homalodisca liturata TaxID=320908 RepID=A0A1B6IDX1_9HEMI|nr:ethanolamine kinase 1 [Homalodisca vitripennis]XP_046665617.1 ethanolamine kinase 1 [Homalodisca vitripennis]